MVAGYPERLEPGEVETTTEDAAAGSEIKVGANSAVFYGPNGEWAGGYRKTNLFETDMTWAIPGRRSEPDGTNLVSLRPHSFILVRHRIWLHHL